MLWLGLTTPLCFGVYSYFHNRAQQAEAEREQEQEKVLTTVFESIARFGDLVNSKAEVETIGRGFGLKRMLVCRNGVDVIGLMTAVSCSRGVRSTPLVLMEQQLELQYEWDPARKFDRTILSAIAVTALVSLATFGIITWLIYNFLIDKVKTLSQQIAVAETSASVREIRYEIIEFQPIVNALISLQDRIEQSNRRLAQMRMSEAISKIARQVAHDIRSPLSALRILAAKISNPDQQELMKATVERIDGIASDLLKQDFVATEGVGLVSASVLRQMLEMKSTEFGARANIRLVSAPEQAIQIAMIETVLFRCLSTLINNSVEASEKKAEIAVSATSHPAGLISVSVSDRGQGIPSELLAKLGKVSVSSGKSGHDRSGSGLGVLSVFDYVQAAGGYVEIESKINEGTTFTLRIPILS
jgi:signal transduction histidine kinase